MTITKIERQKRNPRRVNVYLDGEFAFGLHENVLVKFGLRKGDTLDKPFLDKIQLDEEHHLAKEKALRLLGHHARSEKELRDKLREKEFHPDAIDSAIESMRQLGLVNDLAYARAYAHDALMKKPSGTILLQQKLRLKGIDRNTIQSVLTEVGETNDEQSLALTAARQILKRYEKSKKHLDPLKKKQLVTANLARRGFNWQIIASTFHILFKQSIVEQEEGE